LLFGFGFVAGGTVGVDGPFCEVIGTTTGDAEDAPAVPKDVRVSINRRDASRSNEVSVGPEVVRTVPSGSDLRTASAVMLKPCALQHTVFISPSGYHIVEDSNCKVVCPWGLKLASSSSRDVSYHWRKLPRPGPEDGKAAYNLLKRCLAVDSCC